MPFLNWSDLPSLSASPGRSMRLVDADKGTLIRLDCDGPTVVDTHVHDEIEQISVVLDGEMEFSLGDAVKTIRPGDLVHVPAGAPHGMRVLEGKKAVAVEFFTPPREDLRQHIRSAK